MKESQEKVKLATQVYDLVRLPHSYHFVIELFYNVSQFPSIILEPHTCACAGFAVDGCRLAPPLSCLKTCFVRGVIVGGVTLLNSLPKEAKG